MPSSIRNRITGDVFQVDISQVTTADLKAVNKKNSWLFNWRNEFKQLERDVFKLTTVHNNTVIQGLISLQVNADHVYMHLVENAPFNRSTTKMYLGVMENLVTYACKLSFQRGHEGYVVFIAKTRLITHYAAKLNAVHLGGGRMIIYPKQAFELVNTYFN